MTAMYVTDQKDGWLHYIHTQDQEADTLHPYSGPGRWLVTLHP